ncbi:Protein of unknown function DUF4817 [Trinorchestia longiramus]|nr:Protein of unknown function DUF4817 [Trinorchestia longiramus]
MQLTKEQRIFIDVNFFDSNSFQHVQELFQERFPESFSPSKVTIWKDVRKYKTEGTSRNLNKDRSGRKSTERATENVEIVHQALLANPDISSRKNGLGKSKSTFNRIVKLELKWHPYKMHVRHKLLDTDLPRRLNFAQWFLQKIDRFIEDIVIGDKAAFHLNGKVNSHNVRRYAPKNNPPDFNYNVEISREKVSIWMGLCGNGCLLGSFFTTTI